MAKKVRKIKRESNVRVTRTIQERGKELGGDEADKQIGVHEFVTEPAVVGLEKQLPVQLARFLIAKVNVTMVVPCYVEEISETQKILATKVDEILVTEATTLPDLLKEVMEKID